MFKIAKKKKKVLRNISIIIGMVLALNFSNVTSIDVIANTYASQPGFSVKIDPITPNPALVGQDITIKGQIVPQDFENKIQKKQIVLVLDTSGSMALDKYGNKNTTKIDNMKSAANKFIDTMANVSNMEIAVVEFSSKAVINPGPAATNTVDAYSKTSYGSDRYGNPLYYGSKIPAYPPEGDTFYPINDSTNKDKVKGFVSNLIAGGGTSTGEGLRKAAYMLSQKSDPQASKTIVFMSDGLPTFYSINGDSVDKSYISIDNTNPNFAGTGSDSDSGTANGNVDKSTQYAKTIGNIIKSLIPNIKVYTIGYGLGDHANDVNNMQAIHQSMGGSLNDGSFFSTDANAIDSVFSNISDKIIDSYTISDLKINLESAVNFDSNFSLNLAGRTLDVRNVNYKRDTSVTTTYLYHADPIPFEFTIKANKAGDYLNLFQGAYATAPWNGGNIQAWFPDNTEKVTVTDGKIPNINAEIVSQNPDPASRNDNITLSTKITPDNFNLNSTILDVSGPKDVLFLVDTSIGMSEYMTNVKNGLFGKIVNNSNVKNAQYGIVTFNSTIKSDYVSGLTSNTNILDNAIKAINCSSSDDVRNVGAAMDKARDIFNNSGRADSTKYIIIIASKELTYTKDQLYNMETTNCKTITVNLGHINPPYKQDNTVIPGATEPDNTTKDLHYNLIGKSDNGDNVLQKAAKGYYINVNYSLITNTSNPNDFFTKEENANQMNGTNETVNNILDKVAAQLENATGKIPVPSFTFYPKLRFDTAGGKFTSVSGLNSANYQRINPTTNNTETYNLETPSFPVEYDFDNGVYKPKAVNNVSFTININQNADITGGLKFGPGVISYQGVSNSVIDNTIPEKNINLKSAIQIQKHGVYEGTYNLAPQIDEKTEGFTFLKDQSVSFGATLKGALSNGGVKLQLPTELTLISSPITVYTYDDNGIKTQVGTMVQSDSNSDYTTYVYNGANITGDNTKILILYDQKMPSNPTKSSYINKLITSDNQEKDVKIEIAGDSPDLF